MTLTEIITVGGSSAGGVSAIFALTYPWFKSKVLKDVSSTFIVHIKKELKEIDEKMDLRDEKINEINTKLQLAELGTGLQIQQFTNEQVKTNTLLTKIDNHLQESNTALLKIHHRVEALEKAKN